MTKRDGIVGTVVVDRLGKGKRGKGVSGGGEGREDGRFFSWCFVVLTTIFNDLLRYEESYSR